VSGLVAAIVAGVVCGYVGRVVPLRVAAATGSSVRAVRRGVALAGLLVGSLVVWLVPAPQLDWPLAVGLPLAPVVFAAAALTATGGRPGARLVIWPSLAFGVALAPLTLALLFAGTTKPSAELDWHADTAVLGADPASAGMARIDDAVWFDMDDRSGRIHLGSAAWLVLGRLEAVQAEVWPAAVHDGTMAFGPDPILVVPVASGAKHIRWQAPVLRDPVDTVTILVGITADGTRVMLDQDLAMHPTPPWTGSVLAWWLGG
jgi:hypothetical protein